MSFFLILILAFLGYYLLLPAFRVWRTMSRLRREAREAFQQGVSGAAYGYGRNDNGRNGGRRRREAPKKARRKVFTRDMGEYVAFDEIKVEQTSTSEIGETSRSTVTESQVTDVEWEDLPPRG